MPADISRLRDQIRAIELRGRTPKSLSLGDAALDAVTGACGLPLGAVHEVFPGLHFDQHAAGGFLLGIILRALDQRAGTAVWVRAPGAFEGGRLYGAGVSAFGLDPARLLLIAAPNAQNALWVTEEALKSQGVAAVVLEHHGLLDIAASRRLQLAAELGGGLAVILRTARAPGAGLARTRWRIGAAPSAPPAWAQSLSGLKPPGAPTWRVTFARAGQDSSWLVEWRHAARGFHLRAGLVDDAVASGRSERAA